MFHFTTHCVHPPTAIQFITPVINRQAEANGGETAKLFFSLGNISTTPDDVSNSKKEKYVFLSFFSPPTGSCQNDGTTSHKDIGTEELCSSFNGSDQVVELLFF